MSPTTNVQLQLFNFPDFPGFFSDFPGYYQNFLNSRFFQVFCGVIRSTTNKWNNSPRRSDGSCASPRRENRRPTVQRRTASSTLFLSRETFPFAAWRTSALGGTSCPLPPVLRHNRSMFHVMIVLRNNVVVKF